MRTSIHFPTSTFLSLLTLVLAAGCGSSATTSTAPGPTTINRCAVTINGNSQVPAQGGAGSLAVSAARECVWAASAEGQWLTIKAGASGQGDGSIEFNAAANPDPAVRRGAIVLNEQRAEVIQAAGECVYSLSEASGSFPQAGGAGRFEVRASSGMCSWTAQSDAPWVSVRAGANGQGTATVQFDVSAAGGQPRNATITAAGLRFSVVQTAANCAYEVAPGAFTAAAGGDTLTVTVTTGPGCPWTAASTVPWISLSSADGGTGNGSAAFSISSTSAARSGSVVVAGRTVAVNQGGGTTPPTPCAFTISPESAAVPSVGGLGAVIVTTAAGCAWTAASNSPWLTVTEGASGVGPGVVSYQAAAGVEARSGSLTIAGRTFTVNQSAGCSYSLAPEVQNVDAGEREVTVDVQTSPGCGWTAASNAPWITLRDAGGSGAGRVRVVVASNPGPARSGTATIAGRTLTVNQAGAACSYNVSPLEIKVNEDPQLARIGVETTLTCGWTAVSNAEWIAVISSLPGIGSGEVLISISGSDGKARNGTVTVAGQTVQVQQKNR